MRAVTAASPALRLTTRRRCRHDGRSAPRRPPPPAGRSCPPGRDAAGLAGRLHGMRTRPQATGSVSAPSGECRECRLADEPRTGRWRKTAPRPRPGKATRPAAGSRHGPAALPRRPGRPRTSADARREYQGVTGDRADRTGAPPACARRPPAAVAPVTLAAPDTAPPGRPNRCVRWTRHAPSAEASTSSREVAAA